MENIYSQKFELLEEELYALFDHITDTEWVNRAIVLYRNWLEMEPNNEKIRDQLLDLLLRSGGDKKMKWNHYAEARQLFQEVLQVEPDNRLAHYRLGFISCSEQRWEQAIVHFRKALRGSGRRMDRQLNDEQYVKALCYEARAHRELSRRALKEAIRKHRKIADMQEFDNLDAWIEETKDELSELEEQNKPYALITKTGRSFLTRKELDAVENDSLENQQNLVFLSFLHHRNGCELRTGKAKVYFSEQQAKLLHFLMEAQGPVSSQTIFEKIYHALGNKSKVRRMISSLRESIQTCFEEEVDTVIQTTKQGYLWNDQRGYLILYPRDKWEHIEVMEDR